jgi:hypothetical protein
MTLSVLKYRLNRKRRLKRKARNMGSCSQGGPHVMTILNLNFCACVCLGGSAVCVLGLDPKKGAGDELPA